MFQDLHLTVLVLFLSVTVSPLSGKVSFRQQMVCNFDIVEKVSSLFLLLFIHMYLHISYYLVIYQYVILYLPYFHVSNNVLSCKVLLHSSIIDVILTLSIWGELKSGWRPTCNCFWPVNFLPPMKSRLETKSALSCEILYDTSDMCPGHVINMHIYHSNCVHSRVLAPCWAICWHS